LPHAGSFHPVGTRTALPFNTTLGWRDGDHTSLFDWQRFTLLAALRPGTFYRGWEHVPQELERIGPRRGLGSTEEGGEELSQRSCHQPSVDRPDKAGMFQFGIAHRHYVEDIGLQARRAHDVALGLWKSGPGSSGTQDRGRSSHHLAIVAVASMGLRLHWQELHSQQVHLKRLTILVQHF
jgi:hypothetical protein